MGEEHNLGAKCGHFGTPRHIWTSTSIDGNFGREKNTLNFFGEEAILRRKKKFNRRRMMEWRYHQAIYHQKWSEAIDPTVFSSGDVHDDLIVLSVVCAEKKV